jgi:hypothetical protein
MANVHANDAVDSFFELEQRFAEFLSVVTFKSEHLRVHSPFLASVLLDAGSLVESIFKSALDNARYNNIPNIAAIRQRRYNTVPPYYTINDSRAAFRSDWLYARRVWFIPRGDRSFPWSAWMQRAGHPRWWTSYNRVKHDRFAGIHEAKLGTVMHALGGAFLLLVQTLDFRVTLVDRGIIRSPGLQASVLRPIAAGWEPLATDQVVIARSQFFGYKFQSTGSPQQANDVSVFW